MGKISFWCSSYLFELLFFLSLSFASDSAVDEKVGEKVRRDRRKEARLLKKKKKFDSWTEHQVGIFVFQFSSLCFFFLLPFPSSKCYYKFMCAKIVTGY